MEHGAHGMKKTILALLFFLAPFSAFADYTITTGTGTSTALCNIGYSSTNQYCGQSFTTIGGGNFTDYTAYIYADNNGANPTDSVTLTLELDSGGNPTGIALSSVTVSAATLGVHTRISGRSPYTFVFPTYTLATTTKYWIIGSRTGALSTNDIYTWVGATTNNYTGGGLYSFSPTLTTGTLAGDGNSTFTITTGTNSSTSPTTTSDQYFNFWYVVTDLLPSLAIAVAFPMLLVGVLNRFLKRV